MACQPSFTTLVLKESRSDAALAVWAEKPKPPGGKQLSRHGNEGFLEDLLKFKRHHSVMVHGHRIFDFLHQVKVI